jgi:signal transduction histidine kinase
VTDNPSDMRAKGKIHLVTVSESHWITMVVKRVYIFMIIGALCFFVFYISIDVLHYDLKVLHLHRIVAVIHEVNRIDKIVRDLLNYAKPKPPSHLDINLPEMMQRTVAMVRKSVKHESLSIELHELSYIPGFTADETQLEQVILNLLLNAQYSMPPGGKIDIRFSYDPQLAAVRIEVEDNGPGIPEEARKKLFQPFFTTRRDGTGLGLATCMKNVQYHGGSIEVHSQMGQGTRFLITLPMISRL